MLKAFLVRQLGKPSGWFAPITARLLNKGNARQNEDCIDALDLEPHFEVLDIGFGGGVSFPRLLRDCPSGRVAGAEISGEMIARATAAWRREIDEGRLRVVQGGADRLQFDDESFHRAMTVNTLYFWPDLSAGLSEVLRVLRPGGRFVASVVPAEMLHKIGFGEAGFRTEPPDFYERAFREAGYADVGARPSGDGKGATLISGSKPPAI